ncbi:hypothetical protein G7Y79_00006g019370 [Physcia stellaris]|nr:hypothetical protein G7Y79_00006g019370 [Physcia stellaris]
MVYTGKPSGGCALCRSQFDIAWRDQNEVASKGVQRRLKERDRADRDRTEGNELMKLPTHDVPNALPQDYENYAVNFFFNSYILKFWTKASPTSPLRPAVNAVALALLEAWSWRNPNSPQSLAQSHYLRAIAGVRRHLLNTGDTDDDILMATLMLDMYDGVTSFCGSRPHSGLHLTGSKALVENRKRHSNNSDISQQILLGIRSLIVGRAISKREPVSTDMLAWTKDTSDAPTAPGFVLEEISLEVANVQAAASGLIVDLTGKASSTVEILAEANKLDQRLVAWVSNIPDDWVPTYIWDPESIPRSIRDAGLYQNHCSVHMSIFTANMLNGHCCSRIKVQLVILACLEHLDSTLFETARVNATNNVQDLADTICASVPYFLGDRVKALRIDDRSIQYPRIGSQPTPVEHYETAAAYAGIFLTQKLAQLLQPELPLRDGQRRWILGQMQRIKKVYRAG